MAERSNRRFRVSSPVEFDDITPDEMNALEQRIDLGDGHSPGWLSNLVWNTRNNYLAHPETTFDARTVRMLVEGFMAEIRRLRATGTGTTDRRPEDGC